MIVLAMRAYWSWPSSLDCAGSVLSSIWWLTFGTYTSLLVFLKKKQKLIFRIVCVNCVLNSFRLCKDWTLETQPGAITLRHLWGEFTCTISHMHFVGVTVFSCLLQCTKCYIQCVEPVVNARTRIPKWWPLRNLHSTQNYVFGPNSHLET